MSYTKAGSSSHGFVRGRAIASWFKDVCLCQNLAGHEDKFNLLSRGEPFERRAGQPEGG